MKKILLVVFSLMAFRAAHAQFNQGRMLLGGSVSFSSFTEKSNTSGVTSTPGTTTTFSFTPSLGYFVIDKLAVGGGISWASDKFSPDSGKGSSASVFLFAPLVRYYLGGGFFGQGTVGIGSSKADVDVGTSTITVKGSVTAWSLAMGYTIFLNDHVAIEPLMTYQSSSTKYDGTGSPKDTDAGLAISLGVRAFLGVRK